MADRKRSQDGTRDTDGILSETEGPGLAGRAGGELARRKGAEDEEKRAYARPAGATRVSKSEEKPGGEDDEDNTAG